ncbi:ABC transporter ATP-binding protein [Aeromicrobium wangtongii]|uniref:ABC transporter ATP-binding protein n=1 Tax=Aeromicrobium wangtongii TaxID=2969247 RepID=A0ABY5M406_9ACTN|nr:ABC transporter ATP-binding protein [Aeromicrobium wangtongii]MCD9199065.1 ABC transporter ATP-binding protein [Aeromicrobium wangtongii]MCL3819993.1 ABC transporter ATP-binding protein [Aeromicrobium wangtongii]UUP12904.1 ABC transporter ATP-binding protein [Aeromicrobium wangtongii]
MSATVLAARGVEVRFGGVRALRGVDLEVRPGQIVGLIGPNGAGKTTFVDAITGFVPSTGSVQIGGREISHQRPHARVRAGLSRTWQGVELFDDLTVEENLTVASRRLSLRSTVRDLVGRHSGDVSSVRDTLEDVGISELAEAFPPELSEGQRKLVGIARSFAARPKVLCLDEPAAGLDTAESAHLGKQLRRLGDQGTPMLLIDHDISFVFGTCDHVVVLEFGQVIASGEPSVIRSDPRVIAAYLGQEPAGEGDQS